MQKEHATEEPATDPHATGELAMERQAAAERDRLRAEIEWALSTAIESPAERADAVACVVENLRLLCLSDASQLLWDVLKTKGLAK
jgi:hypothetical protein